MEAEFLWWVFKRPGLFRGEEFCLDRCLVFTCWSNNARCFWMLKNLGKIFKTVLVSILKKGFGHFFTKLSNDRRFLQKKQVADSEKNDNLKSEPVFLPLSPDFVSDPLLSSSASPSTSVSFGSSKWTDSAARLEHGGEQLIRRTHLEASQYSGL